VSPRGKEGGSDNKYLPQGGKGNKAESKVMEGEGAPLIIAGPRKNANYIEEESHLNYRRRGKERQRGRKVNWKRDTTWRKSSLREKKHNRRIGDGSKDRSRHPRTLPPKFVKGNQENEGTTPRF